MKSDIRFASVTFVAFVIDIVLVLFLRKLLQMPLWLCVAVSFVTIGVALYFVHEYWTFKRRRSGFSYTRLRQTMLTIAIAFIVRVGLIALLATMHQPGDGLTVAYVIVGGLASFVSNYLLIRFWVFENHIS